MSSRRFRGVDVRTVGLAEPADPEPPWPDRVQGMAFSPFCAGQDPVAGCPRAQIDADLQLLAGKVTAVRTYSSLKSLGQVPASPHAISSRSRSAPGSTATSRRTRRRSPPRSTWPTAFQRHSPRHRQRSHPARRSDRRRTARQLDRVRAAVEQPVSTAEPWHVWIKHPELAEHVDFITVHLLPYWEGIRVEQAVDYSRCACAQLAASVSRQADRHRRSRLAVRRPHARGGGRVDEQRSAVPAPLPRTRPATKATSTT